MTYKSHGFTVDDSLARSQAVYEVTFEDWGFRGGPFGAPSNNFQYPPPGLRAIPSSLAAIAIGPRSTIDRCWVTWDRQKILTLPSGDNPHPDDTISPSRIVTVDAPLLFSQTTRAGTLGQSPPGGPGQSPTEAMQQGLMYVFPWASPIDGPPVSAPQNIWSSSGEPLTGLNGNTTTLPLNYVSMFGAAVAFVDQLEKPYLHLLLYLKEPPPPPLKRGPFLRTAVASLGAGNAGYVIRYPIYGRKHIRVQFVSHNFEGIPAQITDLRVGLIRNINENTITGLGDPTPVFEVKAGEALAIPKDTAIEIALDNPCADYLSLHVTNGNVGPAGFAWTVVAED